MRSPYVFLAIAVLLLVLCPVVNAVDKVNVMNDTAEYSFTANTGDWIYEIDVGELPMGANQTHYLEFEGSEFILTIGSAQSWGIYHDFDISLTYPNGVTNTTHKSSTRISGGKYRTLIQPVFTQSEGMYNAYITVNLEIGLTPLAAAVGTAGMSATEWDPASAIPFTSASGSLGAETDVSIYTVTKEEFEENITNYNPWFNASSFISDILSWAWSGVIAFLNAIPVIGPIAVTFLVYAGQVLTGLMFWLSFLFTNFPAIALTAETMIMFAAIINSGNNLSSILKKWFNYNVSAVKGLFWFLNLIKEWIVSLINMISNIVASLH
jgi:opacity protein-like surface antigen